MPASVVAAEETVLNTNATSHFLNVPAGAEDGHRLLVIANTGKNNLSPSMAWGGGFVELMDQTASEGGGVTLGMAEVEVSGTPPGTVQITTVNNTRCVGLILAITGHDPATPTEVAFLINASDPPNLAPSWGSELTLFGAVHSGSEDPFPFPAFVLPDEQHEIQGNVTKLYVCMQTLEAANLDPATWQSGSPETSQRVVATFAIRGLAGGASLGPLEQTNTLTALAQTKSKPVAQISETDTTAALTVFKTQPLPTLVETDTIQDLAGSVKMKPLGDILVESDAVLPVGVTQILGQLLDTGAQMLPMAGGVKSLPLAQLTATDALQALTAAKALPLAMLTQLGTLGDIDIQTYLAQLQQLNILLPLLGGSMPDDANATSSGLETGLWSSGLACNWCRSAGLSHDQNIASRGLAVSASSRGLHQPLVSSGLEP